MLPDNSELSVTMWRRTDDRKVWYEWIVDVYIYLLQHPPRPSSTLHPAADEKQEQRKDPSSARGRREGSRRVRIGGSELHSSEKDACLL